MKRNTIFLIAILLLAIFVSCKKETNMVAGTPSISRVALSVDQDADLSSGDINQWIVIIGANLKGATNVFFSDLEVVQKDIYSTDSSITVKIPRQVPAQVTNKITVVTPGGTASYDFVLNTPPFTFTGLKNEFTPEGDTLVILGDFFDLYFKKEGTVVTFTGGKTANLTDFSAGYMKLVVPAGAGVGPVTIKGPAPLNSEIVTNSSWYKDNRNQIITQPVLVPATGLITSSPDFPKNPAPFFIKKGPYAAWGWDAFFTSYIDYPAAATGANRANYVLKFEMNTKQPITKGDIIFNIGPSNYYRWPFNYFGPTLDTKGEWVTIALPMSLVGHPDDDNSYISLIYSDGESRESNYAMCNFRVVPKN